MRRCWEEASNTDAARGLGSVEGVSRGLAGLNPGEGSGGGERRQEVFAVEEGLRVAWIGGEAGEGAGWVRVLVSRRGATQTCVSRKFFLAATGMVCWEGPALGALAEVCGRGWGGQEWWVEGGV